MIPLTQLYYKSTGYSYTHMGRMFLRLFVGLMLAQIGLRQLALCNTEMAEMVFGPFYFPIGAVIIIELFCSFCIMIGFLTRLMIFPPFVLMIIVASRCWGSLMLMTTPFMFLGIYFFILLVGPGKISIDYFLSLYLINRNNGSESELEEV